VKAVLIRPQYFKAFGRIHRTTVFRAESRERAVAQARVAASKVVGSDAMQTVVDSVTLGNVYLRGISLTKPVGNPTTNIEAKVAISLRRIYRPHLTKLQKLPISRTRSHIL